MIKVTEMELHEMIKVVKGRECASKFSGCFFSTRVIVSIDSSVR